VSWPFPPISNLSKHVTALAELALAVTVFA
jgi:hypothetical protein